MDDNDDLRYTLFDRLKGAQDPFDPGENGRDSANTLAASLVFLPSQVS